MTNPNIGVVVAVELVLACMECGKDVHITTELTLGRPNFLGEPVCPKCLADLTGEDEEDFSEAHLVPVCQKVDFEVGHLVPVSTDKNPSGWESVDLDTVAPPSFDGWTSIDTSVPQEPLPEGDYDEDIPF